MELSKDCNHRPIIFIRFNPDDYIENGKKFPSCWANNKNGICVVKKNKKNEWEKRLSALTHQINYWIDPQNITNKTVDIIELFFGR